MHIWRPLWGEMGGVLDGWGENEMLFDVGGGGLGSVQDIQS